VVGTDVAHRSRAETRDLIGLFVNQVVLRTNLSGNPTFRQVVHRVQRIALEALSHQDVPFDRLVEYISPERASGSNPLFQVMVVMQTATAASVKLAGLRVEPIHVPIESAPFDLTVAFAETKAKTLRVDFRYK